MDLFIPIDPVRHFVYKYTKGLVMKNCYFKKYFNFNVVKLSLMCCFG